MTSEDRQQQQLLLLMSSSEVLLQSLELCIRCCWSLMRLEPLC